MGKEEYLYRLSLLQEEANKLEEQINIVNQQINEFEILKLSLEKIDEGREILAGLGKGVFVKSETKEKELFVNVGCGIVVKKNIQDTGEIVDKQIKQMFQLKVNLLHQIEQINIELQNLVERAGE